MSITHFDLPVEHIHINKHVHKNMQAHTLLQLYTQCVRERLRKREKLKCDRSCQGSQFRNSAISLFLIVLLPLMAGPGKHSISAVLAAHVGITC